MTDTKGQTTSGLTRRELMVGAAAVAISPALPPPAGRFVYSVNGGETYSWDTFPTRAEACDAGRYEIEAERGEEVCIFTAVPVYVASGRFWADQVQDHDAKAVGW